MSAKLPPATRDMIIGEIERFIGAGHVGFVKIRISSAGVKRVFVNTSLAPPASTWTCPEDGAALEPIKDYADERFRCSACGTNWPIGTLKRVAKKRAAEMAKT